MTAEDREALDCILERNGYNETKAMLVELARVRQVAGWMNEGLSLQEANDWYNELQERNS